MTRLAKRWFLVMATIAMAAPIQAQDFIGDFGSSVSARTQLEEDQVGEVVVERVGTAELIDRRELMTTFRVAAPLAAGEYNFCALEPRRPAARAAMTFQPSVAVNEDQVRPGTSLAYARNMTAGRSFEITSTYGRTETKHSPRDFTSVGGQGKVVFYKGGAPRQCQERCAADPEICDNVKIAPGVARCANRCQGEETEECRRECVAEGTRKAKSKIDSCTAKCLATPLAGVTVATSLQAIYSEHSGTRGNAVIAAAKTFDNFEFNATAGWAYFRAESGDTDEDAFAASFGVLYSFTPRLLASVSYSIDNDVAGDDSWTVFGIYDLTPEKWADPKHRFAGHKLGIRVWLSDRRYIPRSHKILAGAIATVMRLMIAVILGLVLVSGVLGQEGLIDDYGSSTQADTTISRDPPPLATSCPDDTLPTPTPITR